jgi:DNA-binding IclR family transcriptional regulator
MLRILDLQEEAPGSVLSAETLQQARGFTHSTFYRYLKILTDAGLVAPVNRGFLLGLG